DEKPLTATTVHAISMLFSKFFRVGIILALRDDAHQASPHWEIDGVSWVGGQLPRSAGVTSFGLCSNRSGNFSRRRGVMRKPASSNASPKSFRSPPPLPM